MGKWVAEADYSIEAFSWFRNIFWQRQPVSLFNHWENNQCTVTHNKSAGPRGTHLPLVVTASQAEADCARFLPFRQERQKVPSLICSTRIKDKSYNQNRRLCVSVCVCLMGKEQSEIPCEEWQETKYERRSNKKALPHWSKAGSFLLSHLDFSAYLSILSLASTLTTLKPSSTSIMESTLQHEKDKKNTT